MKVQNEQSKFDTDEHILVCLSSSPSNARIIHTAAKMAKTLHARFTAIYVQTDTVIMMRISPDFRRTYSSRKGSAPRSL